jgi:DNA polymerase (family 10)
LLLDAEWEDAVMDLQDSEKTYFVSTQDTDLLCIKVLRYLKTHRIRDKLFWERKGDEFHAMVVALPFPEEQVERVLQQFEEIDTLNQQLWPFKIFKGIESDILGNGDLDYEPEILRQFDMVVASVHSNLNMTQDKAMDRLLRAIENPYTTILGHPTGRLLLMREGYPIDHHKVIDACAANGVALELNAHPYRLDIDWRYIDYAMEKGVMVSVNPDAHEKRGYLDMHFGVLSGQKGGLQTSQTLNALNLVEFEAYLAKRKK